MRSFDDGGRGVVAQAENDVGGDAEHEARQALVYSIDRIR